MTVRKIIDDVRDQYAGVARGELNNDTGAVRNIASAFGYSEAELSLLPAEANMGLSCGNPTALAALREGEVVVDLGCGGGMDVFLAARKVGATGRVIGIDMTAEMLERARAGQQKLGLTNVEFFQTTIDRLPLPDNSVDCVISNCVINLVPDKLAVFREILRVLKPGGRVALSDIALKQELPDGVKQSIEAYVGCIAGAILIHEYRSLMERAGFQSVVVTDTGSDLNAYAQASSGCCGTSVESPSNICCGPDTKTLHDGLASVMQNFDANAYAASVKVHALKQQSSEAVNPLPPITEPVKAKVKSMKKVQVYDKPMCCSTGICGPDVDPVLPRFAADLDWLKSQGHDVERFNLAQQPQAFIDNKTMNDLLSTAGVNCLPVVMIDGKVVSQATYPTRDELSTWLSGQHLRHFLPTVQE